MTKVPPISFRVDSALSQSCHLPKEQAESFHLAACVKAAAAVDSSVRVLAPFYDLAGQTLSRASDLMQGLEGAEPSPDNSLPGIDFSFDRYRELLRGQDARHLSYSGKLNGIRLTKPGELNSDGKPVDHRLHIDVSASYLGIEGIRLSTQARFEDHADFGASHFTSSFLIICYPLLTHPERRIPSYRLIRSAELVFSTGPLDKMELQHGVSHELVFKLDHRQFGFELNRAYAYRGPRDPGTVKQFLVETHGQYAQSTSFRAFLEPVSSEVQEVPEAQVAPTAP